MAYRICAYCPQPCGLNTTMLFTSGRVTDGRTTGGTPSLPGPGRFVCTSHSSEKKNLLLKSFRAHWLALPNP